MAKKRGKRNGLRARSKNARKGISKSMEKKLTEVVGDIKDYLAKPIGLPFAVADANAPDHIPVVVMLKSGMLAFGRKHEDRFMAHVPFEDTHRDFGSWENVSHYLLVEQTPESLSYALRCAEEFKDEPKPDPNGPETVYS